MLAQFLIAARVPSKKRGHLLANNSHADAGIAALHADWNLVGVMHGHRFVTTDLDDYFEPKPGRVADVEEMIRSQTGIAYTKPAANYLFQRA